MDFPLRKPLALALALAPALAAAGAPPAVLDPVVVTATAGERPRSQVPAAVDVIDGEALRLARPALSLAEALPRVPGVVVRDRQNQAQDLQLSIRGFGARASFGVRGLRLYSDGIPATMPDGQGQVSHFALPAAERIEVLRGPFSALHGNASGGVVSVTTAMPAGAPRTEVEGLGGADGLWRLGASWAGSLDEDDRHRLRVDWQRAAADGYREHSAWQRDAAQLAWRAQLPQSGELRLLANHLELEADDPQGLTAAQLAGNRRAASAGALQFDTRKTVSQQQLGARWRQPVTGAHELSLSAWTGRRQTFQVLSVPVAAQASPGSGGGVIDLDRDYAGADLRWQWQPSDALTLTAGALHERAEETRRGFENFIGGQLGVVGALRRDEDNRVTGDDAYAQLDWALAERWRLGAGLRHSQVRFASRDRYVRPGNPDDSGALRYSRTTPVLGLLFAGGEDWSVYANAGTGFETPTFAELAYRSDGGSGLNEALRPARSRHVELGARGATAALRWDVALFQARTEDELFVLSSLGGRSVFGNAGLTRRRGAEFYFEAQLAPDWRLAASGTWLDARQRRDVCTTPACAPGQRRLVAGNRLPGVAERSAWAELRWDAGEATTALFEARATSGYFADDLNTARAPGHALLGLGVEHRFGRGQRFTAWARVDNLLGRETIGSVIVNEANGRYFEPAPGRTLMLGLRLSL
ncbi:MAG: hypothetical protein ABS41_13050 [Arenimonas sp. SCN 70-307]|uniref:TonB-dependent receptor family protein n=1 Tax=Arenimonas sp. SCN 70-307 TaxID=1660089 RepID=UPI00086DECA0|nr:TonB-dependent receptor [Arenimonas sp. SCN 70-307]ODS61432.1 MAG: hypothetical protein ABS41_13050 [Arenimonas sp. SCN 70-307]